MSVGIFSYFDSFGVHACTSLLNFFFPDSISSKREKMIRMVTQRELQIDFIIIINLKQTTHTIMFIISESRMNSDVCNACTNLSS
jgi:hypothetical protein